MSSPEAEPLASIALCFLNGIHVDQTLEDMASEDGARFYTASVDKEDANQVVEALLRATKVCFRAEGFREEIDALRTALSNGDLAAFRRHAEKARYNLALPSRPMARKQ